MLPVLDRRVQRTHRSTEPRTRYQIRYCHPADAGNERAVKIVRTHIDTLV
jgi:hypothetical protein